MYQEYAIDPTTICRSFDRFARFWNGLGYGEGRLLSRFPGKWERKLIRSQAYLDLSEGQRKRVEILLKREADTRRRIVPSGRSYDSNAQTWLEAAENCHRQQPFHGILAESNPRSHGSVTCFDDVGEQGDCWATPRPWQVKRWRTDMARAAAPLLRTSREILFVEPYFEFSDRFTHPLCAFLSELASYAGVIKRLEVHLKRRSDEGTPEYFRDVFEQEARAKLRHYRPPDGHELIEKLEFFIWESPDENRMHPRYILTEVAGLGFENGLDETYEGEILTDVTLVDGPSLQRRWQEFQAEIDPTFRPLIHRFKPGI